jgi:hypothetical protein
MDFREDDEVCSELRRLQKQLREVIVANNAIKSKLSSKLAEVMPKEEVERSQKEADAHLERTYSKMAVSHALLSIIFCYSLIHCIIHCSHCYSLIHCPHCYSYSLSALLFSFIRPFIHYCLQKKNKKQKKDK